MALELGCANACRRLKEEGIGRVWFTVCSTIQEKQWEMYKSVRGEDLALSKHLLGLGIAGIVLMC